MELMQEAKGYSDSREELEEEEEAAEEIITREESSSSSKHFHYPFSSPSLSSSPSITNHHHHHHHHHNHHHVINIDSPHQPKNQWLGMVHDHNHHHHHYESPDATTTTESHQNSSYGLGLHHHQDAASNYIKQTRRQQQLDFMDLSLGTNNNHESNNFQGPLGGQYGTTTSTSTSTSTNSNQQQQQQQPAEKENMFDKVVTPSDVGKLNRLVIPKQHAEKYFPLDSTSNEKGLLLNFEDRNGKLWRFRYSYWNSSQSYVMTKGWSRFVKEKKLDAGDIVSFQRGVGELYRHRLYIDWRRRPDHYHHHHHGPDPSTNFITPFFLPNQPHLSQYSIRWGGRFYSLPSPQAPPRHHHDQQHFQRLNYNNMYPFHQQQQQQHGGGSSLSHHYSYNSEMNSGSGSVYYLRSTTPSMPMADNQGLTRQQQQEGGNIVAPMIIDSVPVAHHHHNHHVGSSGDSGNSSGNNSSTAGKRLRLFGVNMECASSTTPEDPKCFTLLSSHMTMANNSLASSSLPSLQRLRVPQNEEPLSSSSSSARFGDQRGEAAVVFDLDPSLQYHQ